jgi:hypothetical protein
MTYRYLPLDDLLINRANDRHGELENETASIAWLFNHQENHMRNLAKDIVSKSEVFEPPLVFHQESEKAIVYDGNRRVTCLKLLQNPRRAPTVELQEFFREQRAKWQGEFPERIQCQIETDRDRIDDILFRRHTGSQGGVGQTTWDDRMKTNFIERTGRGDAFNLADEIQKKLTIAGKLPHKKIPRSTLNRLLSAEALRNRVGITVNKGKLEFTHQEAAVLPALQRIADDLALKKIVLGDIWDLDGKRDYLNQLETEGVLPRARHALKKADDDPVPSRNTPSVPRAAKPSRRTTLIPDTQYTIIWAGRLQRHRAIWEELQFRLHLAEHPNAISVLFRVLLELSIENYIGQTKLGTVHENDKLARKALRVAEDLQKNGKIDQKYLGVFQKLQHLDPLVSMDTLNRYVHSPNFAPAPEHLTALWDTFAQFIVHCLNA